MKKINWLTTIALCVVLLNFAAGCSNVGLSGSVQADSSAGHSENTSAAATTILPSPSTENAYGGGTGNPAGADNGKDNSASAENVPAEFNIPSITIAVGERHAFSVRGWTANNPAARAFYVSENAVIGERPGHDDLIIFYNGSTYTIPVTVTAQKQAEAEGKEETSKAPVWMKQALEPNASVWADGVNAPAGLESIWVEEEGSGFFNVLKTAYALKEDEKTGLKSDANFCYGAAAANLVHWWEKANQKPTSYKLKGDYTTGYMESSVYNMFLKKNNNGSGGDERQPLYDYFTDTTGTKQTDSPRYVYTFGADNAFDAFCKRMAWIYKSHGTAAITYYDQRFPSFRGKHIVNVWGYETDSSGKISYVWIGDSNMGDSNMKPLRNSRLYKCQVTYGADNAVYLHHRDVSNRLESMTAVFKELTEE
ncbi:MAG: IdeS/Mac family cysteine endopeptidase [Spirochaetia bacterium]|nr:IdeS/Mac family cysteine endopeptidase [Spirochaetia bacterium]